MVLPEHLCPQVGVAYEREKIGATSDISVQGNRSIFTIGVSAPSGKGASVFGVTVRVTVVPSAKVLQVLPYSIPNGYSLCPRPLPVFVRVRNYDISAVKVFHSSCVRKNRKTPEHKIHQERSFSFERKNLSNAIGRGIVFTKRKRR